MRKLWAWLTDGAHVLEIIGVALLAAGIGKLFWEVMT